MLYLGVTDRRRLEEARGALEVTTLLQGVDAVVLRVPSLERGLAFYRDQLGHELIWRTPSAAGLRMGRERTELVLAVDTGPETDVLVESVDDAVERFVRAGGSVTAGPAAIAVGRVAVVADPFGNHLTLVDLSKGTFETDAEGVVTAVRPTAS
ncbi:MAG: VOC family protein [Chloroflexi bacterium]|nr:VOC family protein [Chloroflexota bacterium]